MAVLVCLGWKQTAYAENTVIAKEFWGNQLSSYEYKIYSAIHEYAANGGKGNIEVEFIYDGIWDQGEQELKNKVSDMVARAESAFCFDYPLFWCKNFSYEMQAEGDQLTITLEAEPYYENFWEELPAVADGIHALEEQIRQSGNTEDDFLLVQDIFLMVMDKLEYSYRVDEICQDSAYDDGIVHTVAAAVIPEYHNRGVCSAYSGLFQIMCNDLGIPCIQVTNSLESSEPHSFNLVYLEEEWYVVDVTWADQESEIDWKYFLAGSQIALKEHELGNQLACSMVQTRFSNVEIADTYYYDWTEGTLAWDIPESVVYDANDLEAEKELTVTAYSEPDSIAVKENMEFTVDNTTILEHDTKGQIAVDASKTGFIKLSVSARYVDDTLSGEVYVKSYPEYIETDTGWIVMCRYAKFLAPSILENEAQYYDLTTEKVPYMISFAKSSLMKMESEKVYDFSVSLFTGFESTDYVEGLPQQEEEETLSQLEFIRTVLKRQIQQMERKLAKSDMLFGISFSDFDTVYQEGVLTYHLPEELQQYYGKQIYGYAFSPDGQYQDCGVFDISEDGTLTVMEPFEAMYFYEQPWKTMEEYQRNVLLMGVAAVVVLLAGLLYVRLRRKKDDEDDFII